MFKTPKYLILISALSISSSLSAATPKLNLAIDQITVSGLSSGGYMANQFHIAYSDWVKGAGIISAGPYYCSQGKLGVVLEHCMEEMKTPIELERLNQQAENWVDAEKIAPLRDLADSKVWLLHGTLDETVSEAVNVALYEQYSAWVPQASIRFIKDKAFAHLFPTLSSGGDCTESESPYIGQCGYDAAGEMLNFLLGDLQTPDNKIDGEIIEFNQQDLAGTNAITLGKTGYAFIPKTCAEGESCQVHVSFHGCEQSADAIGMDYVENTGLNRWADDNHLVVIYPQSRKSWFAPLNPKGCWDWWGYADKDFANRNGLQIQAVKAIIEGLAN